ncbi:MAG: DUF4830 domain-containing protein [Oscillospiraceae bacterium]|nr:DUF4830 domain-containing protein [Oscillospiraceae bacterium]
MFVLTAKLSKSKLIAAGVILIAAVLLIVLLATADASPAADAKPTGSTNEERVAFLATYGWSVNAEPKEAQKVRIPDTADNRVFARYNDLQKSQGYDLTQYAGKEVMRYVYEILNYPDASSPVYASILVFDGVIIGGDVTNTAPDGVIHGFCKPQAESQATEPVTEPTEAATEAVTECAPED